MLIRHAERPSPDKSIRGVTQEGVKSKQELTVRGWQRAGALVRFFAPRDNRFVHPALARPQILFACKAGPAAPSLRPQHSLLPLASLIETELNCDTRQARRNIGRLTVSISSGSLTGEATPGPLRRFLSCFWPATGRRGSIERRLYGERGSRL
jgi:hypothetical protein